MEELSYVEPKKEKYKAKRRKCNVISLQHGGVRFSYERNELITFFYSSFIFFNRR